MAFEKRLPRVSPQLFTSNGTSNGQITVDDSCLFKVKQKVVVTASGLEPLELEVKRITDDTTLFLGPRGGSIKACVDLSAYTTGLGSAIQASEQERPNVPEQEVERITYEEEPTVARRVILVDKLGNLISEDNPLEVNASVTIDEISVDLCADDGDNLAISAHPNQIFDEGADTLTTAAFEEIYSYTSANNDTKITQIEVSLDTTSTVQVKLDGDVIRERRIGPGQRNANFVFTEHRSVASGSIISVEAKVDRLIRATYNSFTSLEGYIGTCT